MRLNSNLEFTKSWPDSSYPKKHYRGSPGENPFCDHTGGLMEPER
jgi:hypothetical protein